MKRNNLEILHKARYSGNPTIEGIESDIKNFLKGCKDIIFEDTFSVAVNLKEVLHLAYQVFNDERDGGGKESLIIDLSRGDGFPPFANVYVRKPNLKLECEHKLDLIEKMARDIQESFEKRDSKVIENQIESLLNILK
jgi:hypothetical protein